MDKILLVFYVGVKSSNLFNETSISIKKYMNELTEKEDFITFILPDHELTGNSIKLECINPKFVNKSVYDLILNKVSSIEENIKQKFECL